MEENTNKQVRFDNKKIAYIALAVVFFAAMLTATVFVLSKHDNTRHSITVEQFKDVADESGYTLYPSDGAFEKFENLEDISIASDDKEGYDVEFLLFKDDDTAKEIFDVNKKIMSKEAKKTKAKTSNTNFGNYNNFNATTNERYMYLTRVDRTLLYVNVDVEHKAEVKAFTDKIKY